MLNLTRKSAFLLGLLVVFVVIASIPAQAQFTKLYSIPNNTGANQTSVRAITLGLESITYSYSDPTTWAPALAGYVVISGVFSSTVTFDGPAAAPGSSVTIGFRTADNSCRLRDLRWGGGQAIVPTQLGGVPGGGIMVYDYPNPGDLTIIITNDTDGILYLTNIEVGQAIQELGLEDLSYLADAGLLELYIIAIDEDIAVLRQEINEHLLTKEISSPSARSLTGKLDSAESYKHQGLDEFLAGNLSKALFLWGKAAKQMENFISEVTNGSEKGNIPTYLYERWILGGGGITSAPEILADLLALPEGDTLQNLASFPSGVALPPGTGLDPNDYQPWPVDLLNPGEFTAFVLSGAALDSGFILRGSVADGNGTIYLNWIEQGLAAPTSPDTEAPVIHGVTATPENLWSPDHTMREITLDVDVTDDSGVAVWYIVGVTSNQPENGTGDGDYSPDWLLDPNDVQSLQLRSERSGNDPAARREYTVTLEAIDMAGNISAPFELVVPVDHDSSN